MSYWWANEMMWAADAWSGPLAGLCHSPLQGLLSSCLAEPRSTGGRSRRLLVWLHGSFIHCRMVSPESWVSGSIKTGCLLFLFLLLTSGAPPAAASLCTQGWDEHHCLEHTSSTCVYNSNGMHQDRIVTESLSKLCAVQCKATTILQWVSVRKLIQLFSSCGCLHNRQLSVLFDLMAQFKKYIQFEVYLGYSE